MDMLEGSRRSNLDNQLPALPLVAPGPKPALPGLSAASLGGIAQARAACVGGVASRGVWGRGLTAGCVVRRGRVRASASRVAMAATAAPAPGLISVFSSAQELGAALAQLVAQRAACCLAGARARFALGLSGGSLVSLLARELPAAAAPAGPAGLARWTLGFCDERLVPFEHADSTFGLYRVGERRGEPGTDDREHPADTHARNLTRARLAPSRETEAAGPGRPRPPPAGWRPLAAGPRPGSGSYFSSESWLRGRRDR